MPACAAPHATLQADFRSDVSHVRLRALFLAFLLLPSTLLARPLPPSLDEAATQLQFRADKGPTQELDAFLDRLHGALRATTDGARSFQAELEAMQADLTGLEQGFKAHCTAKGDCGQNQKIFDEITQKRHALQTLQDDMHRRTAELAVLTQQIEDIAPVVERLNYDLPDLGELLLEVLEFYADLLPRVQDLTPPETRKVLPAILTCPGPDCPLRL